MTAYLTCGRAESGLWKRMWTAAAAMLVCCATASAAEAVSTLPAGGLALDEVKIDEAKMIAKLRDVAADPTRLQAQGYGWGYYGWGGYPYAYYGYRPYYAYRSYYPRAYAYPGFYPPAYGSYYATPYYSAAYYAPAVYAAPTVYVAPRAAYYGGYGCANCYHW